MKTSCLVVSACLILSSAAWSEEGNTKHYYPVPLTESADWAYQVPSCRALAQHQYVTLKAAKQCQVLQKGIESCESAEKITLENMANGQTASFKLRYMVLNSQLACQRDRKKYLQAGQ